MRVLYFAWVRERIGADEEAIDLPQGVTTLAGLVDWLRGRSAGHAAALADLARLRFAVDQDFAGLDALVTGAQEVAIFPPVTGG